MKPGYKTTEFWVTLAVTITAILRVLGVIDIPEGDVVNAVSAVSAAVVALGVVWKYIDSRVSAKSGT